LRNALPNPISTAATLAQYEYRPRKCPFFVRQQRAAELTTVNTVSQAWSPNRAGHADRLTGEQMRRTFS
jgi:hypothetical protein